MSFKLIVMNVHQKINIRSYYACSTPRVQEPYTNNHDLHFWESRSPICFQRLIKEYDLTTSQIFYYKK